MCFFCFFNVSLRSAYGWEIYHVTKFKLLQDTVWRTLFETLFVPCHWKEKVTWRRGNKAWQALCFTIQERTVRLASLRLCNSCIINLLPNGLLRMFFFFFLEQFALICGALEWIIKKNLCSPYFSFQRTICFSNCCEINQSNYEALKGRMQYIYTCINSDTPSFSSLFEYARVVNSFTKR